MCIFDRVYRVNRTGRATQRIPISKKRKKWKFSILYHGDMHVDMVLKNEPKIPYLDHKHQKDTMCPNGYSLSI